MKAWLAVARRGDVVRRSLRVALLVGTILVVINHGDRLLSGTAAPADWVKMGLTYVVPYGVSTWASVSAIRGTAGNANGDP